MAEAEVQGDPTFDEIIATADEGLRPLVTLADALAEHDPEPEWLMEHLLPAGGVAVLSAPGGTGKSTLLVQMLATIATGHDFFGFNVPKARRCAFLQCEGSRRIFKDRVHVAVRALGYQTSLPLLIPSKTFSPPLFVAPEFEQLLIASEAQVAVCDTVGYFFDGDENSNSDVKRLVVKPLAGIGGRTGISTFLVHHYGKPSEFRQGRHKTRGASAWIDDVDLAMRLEQVEGGTKQDLVLIFDKIKNGPDREPIRLRYEPSSATFSVVEGEAPVDSDEADREEQERAVFGYAAKFEEVVAANPGFSTKQVEELAGRAGHATKQAARAHLLKQRRVRVEGKNGATLRWFKGE